MLEVIEPLNELLVLDHDAVRAYSAAIDRVTVLALAEKLSHFRTDHERHVSDLTALILKLGGTPRGHADLKGAFLHTVTAMRSLMGDAQALKALRGTETQANKTYATALAQELPLEAERVIRRNFQDEVRHLAWINQAILDGRFEQASEAHP